MTADYGAESYLRPDYPGSEASIAVLARLDCSETFRRFKLGLRTLLARSFFTPIRKGVHAVSLVSKRSFGQCIPWQAGSTTHFLHFVSFSNVGSVHIANLS